MSANESVTLYECEDGHRTTEAGEFCRVCFLDRQRQGRGGEKRVLLVARVFVPAGSGESRVEYRVVDKFGSRLGDHWTHLATNPRLLAWLDADNPAAAPHRVEQRTVSTGPWTTEGDKP